MTALLFEAGGTFAMFAGAIVALALALRERAAGGRVVCHRFRSRLRHAIILGLELLVAADILRDDQRPSPPCDRCRARPHVLIRTFSELLPGDRAGAALALAAPPTAG